jgi:hypothetical protein
VSASAGPHRAARNPMPERWRSAAARALVKKIRDAGGQVERVGVGKLRVAGPAGAITINEPSGETRKDLTRSSAVKRIATETGLDLETS